jgi:hypothetical protein
MRIAVSGSHSTGKSTLIEELAIALPGAVIVDEAYYSLLAEGLEFNARPDAADYQLLWERACEEMAAPREGLILFDRTPADYLAYLVAVEADVAGTELVAQTRDALAGVDLVVFVPIEMPDRVEGRGELRRLRRSVDRVLREMWIEDAWGWSLPVLEVSGTPRDRVQQVLARLGSAAVSTNHR